jgi:hypothetical protein
LDIEASGQLVKSAYKNVSDASTARLLKLGMLMLSFLLQIGTASEIPILLTIISEVDNFSRV